MGDTTHQGGGRTHEEQDGKGAFGRVKEKLNFAKHLGFQSSPDSFGNQEALRRAREREAGESQGKESGTPAVGPTDGLGGIADTLAGAVAPQTGEPRFSQDTSQSKPSQPSQSHKPPEPAVNEAQVEHKPEHDEAKEEHNEKGQGIGRWVAHKVHQMSRAAASKDLSDDLLKKGSKDKASK